MPTCAIYARVSTDKEQQLESVDNQISLLRAFAKQKGEDWEIKEQYIYRDDGITGTSLTARPAVQKMIEDAERGLFDLVMFKGISRFSRDTTDALHMLRLLRQANVRVISFEESYDTQKYGDDEFIFTIHSALAQQESQKISVRVKLGMMEAAKTGRWVAGSPPYGYQVDRETQRLIVDEYASKVVQMMFDLYTNKGWGTHRIFMFLHRNGYKTAKNANWSKKTVIDILRNKVYTGCTIYGRRSFKTEYDRKTINKRKTLKQNDRDDWIIVPDTHSALISEETYERAQILFAKRGTTRSRGDAHVLTGILKCGKCGNGFVHKMAGSYSRGTYNYYICKTRMLDGKDACDQKPIPAESIERMVFDRVKELAKQFNEQDWSLRDKSKGNDESTFSETIDRQIDDIKKQILNANMKNANGIIDDETFEFILKELNQTLDNLIREKNKVVSMAEKRSQNQNRVKTMIEAINSILSFDSIDDDNRAEIRNRLMTLIQYVEIKDDNINLVLRR